jgi:hypothetical protein
MLQLAIQHWTIECLLAWTHGIQPNTTVSWLSVNFLTVITANAASALSGFHKVITTWDTGFDGAWYDCEFDTVLGNPRLVLVHFEWRQSPPQSRAIKSSH